ncbi:MAG: argininosuccinate lyase [Spirochaetales bacterium]|nr:argininosuccinate lyase [Spirochaetales bacterium]
MNTNLWGGRFEKSLGNIAAEYNASIMFDNILYSYSIEASRAHANMLAKQGIISNEDNSEIQRGLDVVKERLDRGEVEFKAIDEDIMMVIEKELTQVIGEPGKRLHTARSRNDQNVVDETLFLRHELEVTIEYLKNLLAMIVKKARQQQDVLMPGFTHLQHAQPITVGFYYMAHFQGLRRDLERFSEMRKRVNINPLGACALAGTTLPTDRFETTRLLGFSAPSENALDTVGNRDNFAEYLFNAALTMIHLSGFAEELIVFNSQEFSFISIDDSYCTGSSIMPQKKNPDIAELVRGKASRTIGNLVSLLTMLKGTFLTLNKDYQEDKEALFDSIHTLEQTLLVFTGMLDNITFREDVLAKQLEKGFIEATDIAEYLVTRGIPFRTAHEMVGNLVKYCEACGKRFCDVDENDLRQVHIDPALVDMSRFSVDNCVRNRKSYGGTSFEDVERQIENAEKFLEGENA